MLQELFTADGIGSQVSIQHEDLIRSARFEDVGDIVEIIRPLEAAGLLVPRSRALLEQEINHFIVAELDGVIVGCCAVYPFADAAELACVAVHEPYRLKPLRKLPHLRVLTAYLCSPPKPRNGSLSADSCPPMWNHCPATNKRFITGNAVLRCYEKPLTHNRNPLWPTNAPTAVWLLTV